MKHPSTSRPLPNACVHELFELQVARTPDAVAVSFGDRRCTYAELNGRANQLAHYLREQGIGPDVLVGVCLERSIEMVVALLAVWKAGGAYVPLDPSYPEERLSFMTGDADVALLLAHSRTRALLPALAEKTFCLDSDWGSVASRPLDNLAGGAEPSNLAYVMYTSGSTGKPKGAMIVHRGLVNYLTWAIEAYGVESGGSVPLHSSISFDLTVTSLYPALLAGAEVEILAEDTAAQNLIAALRRRGDRLLVKITPAHLEILSQSLEPHEAAGLTRCFVIGGENLPAESLRFWRTNAPATRLINEYGPTETVVGCCVHEVRPDDPANGPVPIGKPIANTDLYVMDEALERAGPGAMGELYIGGAGVAYGYLNRADLTRERFLPDRLSGLPGARLYKTGDLARWRDDGILEYLGRADNQVKIRGHRIELGEIEAAIAAHDNVQSCAVLAREETPGDRQLVAYVVPRRGSSVALEDMRAFVKQWLPEFMAPARLVVLESLPLTRNGKVDRDALAALPMPAGSAPAQATGRSPTETRLAEVWSQLLGVEDVASDQDVFDLGAHSLMVMKAVARIRDTFGVDLQLGDVFENPTTGSLAKVIEALAWASKPVAAGGGEAREEITL